MFIDYAILAVLSTAMLVYAYLKRPEGQSPNDGDGGGPRSPRPSPIDRPPTHGRSLPEREVRDGGVPSGDDRPTISA